MHIANGDLPRSSTTPNDVTAATGLDASTVVLGTGLPTREELLVYYPAKFTWEQLKTFVNSGDLGLLKRDKKLQQRYDLWAVVGRIGDQGQIWVKRYARNVERSIRRVAERWKARYLSDYRLQWGKPDTLSLLPSVMNDVEVSTSSATAQSANPIELSSEYRPEYFTADAPTQYISIIQNDWPYSVPPEIEHTLIWTKLPIYHTDLIHPSITARIEQDGLWGFTGNTSPPPSPSTLPQCLPALSEWGMTLDKMIVSQKGTPEEEGYVKIAGKEVDAFVRRRWKESEWETAWFVNPRRLQSVPELAHIHVFARRKI